MAAFVNFLRGLAYAAITFLCIIVGITVLQVRAKFLALETTANTALVDLHQHGNVAIDKLYAHAKLEQKNFDYLILNLGLTANVARQASLKELAVLDTVNASLQKTVDNTNKTLVSTNAAVTKAGALIVTLNQTAKDVQPALAASTAAMDSLNKVVSNPAIPASIAHVDSMTGSGAKVMQDVADKTHKIVHPDKKTGFWATMDGAVLWVHSHIVPPLF